MIKGVTLTGVRRKTEKPKAVLVNDPMLATLLLDEK